MVANLAKSECSPAASRLLVIDDEFRVRRVIANTLARARHQVLDVPSAVAALELLERDQDFDLILCDMMMPQMSGAQLFDRLVHQHPQLARRFAFVSAGASCGAEDALMRSRAVQLLLKPFSPDELLDFVTGQLALRTR
jgi:CheY-like chemotaxis protein